jgi:hypothetical protein
MASLKTALILDNRNVLLFQLDYMSMAWPLINQFHQTLDSFFCSLGLPFYLFIHVSPPPRV